MDDFIKRFYRSLLGGTAKIMLVSLFIGLILAAFWLGFAFDFGSCFGKASCSNNAGYYFLLFPFGVIVGGIFLLGKWKKYKHERYKEQVKEEINQEASYEGLSASGNLEGVILQLLNKYGQLGLEDILLKTSKDRETVLASLRVLMQHQLIEQHFEEGTSFFSLKIKQ